MKVFWSFMVVLFAASMAVLAMPERGSLVATETGATESVAAEPATSASRPVPAVSPNVVEGEVETAQDDAVEVPAIDASEEEAAEAVVVETEAPVVEQDASLGDDPFAAAARAFLGEDEPVAATEEPVEQVVAQIDEPEPADTPADLGEQAAAAEEAAAPSRLAVNEDGSLLIDGRITIPGAGTVERPYVLDWPVLTGVGREYKPEKGMDELPEWLTALEGKRVRLTGHIVLPLVAKATDELLLTMNPWDGCCVGVPPTPYDALEVSLSEAVSMSGASMYGAMEGTFRVDPYIVDGWLLGLYLLEDAEVKG